MKKYHYWIVARDEGKPYLIYACPSHEGEEVARQKGLEMMGGLNFEIKRYPTMDRDTASAFYRGVRLEKGEGLKRASQRIGHEKSLNRLRKRRLHL